MKSELLVFRQPVTHSTWALSARAQRRLLSVPGEPLFIADWDRPLMIHYEVDPVALQRVMPFELDLWDGRAFVSLVAFTLRRMRPRLGGKRTRAPRTRPGRAAANRSWDLLPGRVAFESIERRFGSGHIRAAVPLGEPGVPSS